MTHTPTYSAMYIIYAWGAQAGSPLALCGTTIRGAYFCHRLNLEVILCMALQPVKSPTDSSNNIWHRSKTLDLHLQPLLYYLHLTTNSQTTALRPLELHSSCCCVTFDSSLTDLLRTYPTLKRHPSPDPHHWSYNTEVMGKKSTYKKRLWLWRNDLLDVIT